jgi:hypothetical protein
MGDPSTSDAVMPVWSSPAFRRVVFLSALYDLLVTAPFATPWSFGLVRQNLSGLNQALGGPALPEFAVLPTLFALLMGSLVLVWSGLRLHSPELRFGRYDGVGRVLFATWMGWAWLQGGAPVLALFILPEAAWAGAQLWPVEGAFGMAQPWVRQAAGKALAPTRRGPSAGKSALP